MNRAAAARADGGGAGRLALPALVALALALRLWNLGGESLWLDEGYTWRIARLPLPRLLESAWADVHPPLYYLLEHAWIGAFGTGEAMLRLPSALLGALAVLLAARFGRRLLGARAGLLAGLFVAVSPFHVQFSQEARNYSLLAVLSLLSYFALVAWRERGGAARLAAWVACASAMTYTHNFGWFVLAAQNSWMAYEWERARRDGSARRVPLAPWVAAQAAVVALYLPWTGLFRHQMQHVNHYFWVAPPTPLALLRTAWDYAGSTAGLPLLAVLVALASVRLARPRGGGADPARAAERSALVLLWAWLACGIVLPWAYSLLVAPVFIPRATLPAAFACWLLAAAGAARLTPAWLRRAAVASFALFALVRVLGLYAAPNKERWREATRDVEAAARAGDAVVVSAGYCVPNVWAYYARRADLDVVPFPADGGDVKPASLGELDAAIAGRERVWLVLSHRGDPGGLTEARLAPSFREASRTPYWSRPFELSPYPRYAGVEVVRYERR